MSRSRAAWLLWLLVTVAEARDPFAPPTVASCLHELPALSQWRVQGIIGRDADYRGWLLSPQGQVVAVSSAAESPLYPWRVSAMSALEIHLQAVNSCQPQQKSLRLTGRLYEMDHHQHVVAQPVQPQ